MRYKLLGRRGPQVSEPCLDTITFGKDCGWGSGKDESRRIYDVFSEADGRFIDTPKPHANLASETFLGAFMRGHRESIVPTKKHTNAGAPKEPNAAVKPARARPRRLDEVRRVKAGFPHDVDANVMVRTSAHGGTRELIDA